MPGFHNKFQYNQKTMYMSFWLDMGRKVYTTDGATFLLENSSSKKSLKYCPSFDFYAINLEKNPKNTEVNQNTVGMF